VEAFGIALVLVGGLFAAPIFCLILIKVIRRVPPLALFGFWAAVPLFGLFSVEVVFALSLGVLSTRALVGSAFFLLHVLLTYAAAPALACLLLLGRRSIAGWWPVAAALCWFVGAGAVFYQYDVAETLYGIDGRGGPYLWPW
jgi:hypothetical protein